MKKLSKIFFAVAALFAFSCTTDTTEDLSLSIKGGGTELAISLEESRTQLGEKAGDVYPLYWSEGDKIAVNGVASTALTAEEAGAAGALFTFESELVRPYNIVYPAPAEGVAALTEGQYPVTFLAEQEYTAGTFCAGAAPMYGYAAAETEGAIQLQHLTGVLRFAVKGEGVTLKQLAITSETGALAGTFDVDCATGALTAHDDASNTIKVTFGKGLTLGAEATPIYVAVPAGKYGKIYVMISSESDIMKLTFDSEAKPLNAGAVREFAEFTYAANSSESDIYVIDSKEALIHFAEIAANFAPYTTAKVVAPIDMTGVEWAPVEGFGGYIFDGGEFEIKGLSAPLFGSTAAHIKNVKLTGVNITETEAAFTGAIARRLYGSLNNCSAAGAINVNNTTLVLESFTNAYSDLAHGGLVGMASGATVYNCTNDVDVTVTSFCAADFSCKASIGGVVGASENSSKFNSLTNNGDVVYNGTTQKANVYMSGIVGKKSNVSGMAYIAEFSNCTNNGAVYTAEGSVINADLLISGGTGDIAFGEAEAICDRLVNNGDITHKGKCKNIRMAGVLTYDATVSMTNCSNSGAISVAKGAEASEVRISGITGGEIKAESYSNCTNSGAISFATGAKATKAWLSGISNDTVYAETYSGCTNSGAISIGDGNEFNGEVWIAGVGILVKGIADKNSVINNCTNSGPVSVGAATQKSTAQAGRLYVSGVINRSEGADVSNCYNEATGTVTVKTGAWGSGYMIAGFISYWGYVGGVASYDVTDCENRADILIEPATGEGVTSAPYAELGGISSEAYVGSGDYTINFTRVKNSGNLTVKGTYANANYPYLGGIIGVNNYTKIVMKNCENSGNVTYAGTAPSASVGGIFGYDTNNTSFTVDGCVNSGNITYSGIAGTHVSLGGIGGYRNVSKPTVITNSTNLGTVTLSGEQTATQTEGWAYAVAGFVGRNNGAGFSIENSTNGKLNDATKGTVTVGTAPSGVGLAGFLGISLSAVTISGCKNYGDVKQTGQGAQSKAYRAHIAGIAGTVPEKIQITVTNCENYGTIEYGTVTPKSRVDIGGIIATTPASSTTVFTNCKNGGTIAYKAPDSPQEISVGGIIGTAQSFTTLKDCVNLEGAKIIASGSATTNYEFGGIAGSTASNATVVENCDNYGTVEQTVASKGTTQIGGVIGYAYSFKTITGCDNYGKVIFGGTEGTNANAGGVVGYARFKAAADGVSTISNCGNYCDLEFAGKAKDYYVGGVVGYCRGVESGTAKLENLKNIANLTFNGKGSTSIYLGGICGTFGNEENGHILESGVCYGDIKAIGLTGEFGFAFGNSSTETRYVKNVQIGGRIAYEEADEEDADGIIKTSPKWIDITEDNFFEYLYTVAVTKDAAVANGCSVITEKPAN